MLEILGVCEAGISVEVPARGLEMRGGRSEAKCDGLGS